MLKEYEDIKVNVEKEFLDYTPEKTSEVATRIFNKVFGITVEDATKISKDGKWIDFLKKHSKKDFTDNFDEFKTAFNPTSFEIKEDATGFYVGGFVSSESVDEYGDIVPQQILVNKMNDPSNAYASILSYQHGWIKGDKTDSSALGIKQGDAVLKINPLTGKDGAFAWYKLMKTHPKYENAIYDIKEKAVKGFSIEFKNAKRTMLKIGNVLAQKLDDFFFGGVALVSRPANHDAVLTGFMAKEFIYNEGEDMEVKEEKKVEETKTEEPVKEVPKQPEPVKNDINEKNDDVEKLKIEVSNQKQALEKMKLEAEKAKITTEMENLTAEKKVLVDTSSKTVEDMAPTKEASPVNNAVEEAQKVLADKSLNGRQKIYKILDITDKNKMLE